MSPKKLVIVGHSAFAEIAYEYFTHDSEYEVAAFAVDREFKDADNFMGQPLVELDGLNGRFPPERFTAFVAVAYGRLNRIRADLVQRVKAQGYTLTSYVSSRAFVWRDVAIRENTFIFENNVVQPFVILGSNVVLWSGNHIGHHSKIGDNVFVSSHVVISGYCSVGNNCFFGVNATVTDSLSIGADCWIGPGALVSKDLPEGSIVSAGATPPSRVPARRFFKVQP